MAALRQPVQGSLRALRRRSPPAILPQQPQLPAFSRHLHSTPATLLALQIARTAHLPPSILSRSLPSFGDVTTASPIPRVALRARFKSTAAAEPPVTVEPVKVEEPTEVEEKEKPLAEKIQLGEIRRTRFSGIALGWRKADSGRVQDCSSWQNRRGKRSRSLWACCSSRRASRSPSRSRSAEVSAPSGFRELFCGGLTSFTDSHRPLLR